MAEQNMTQPTSSDNGRPRVLRLTPQEIAILVCAAGLNLCFFAPWVSVGFDTAHAGYQLAREQGGWFYWLIPVLSIATLGTILLPRWRKWTGTAAALVSWLAVAHFVSK